MHLSYERDENAKWRKAIRKLLPKRMISSWYARLVWVMVDCSWMWISELFVPLFVRAWEGGTYAGKLAQRFSLFHRQYCLLVPFNYMFVVALSLSIIYYSSIALHLVASKVCCIWMCLWNGLNSISTLQGKTDAPWFITFGETACFLYIFWINNI